MSFRVANYDAVQDSIGYTFSQRNILAEALDTTGMRTAESNQRLAMLGDAVLKMILLDDWYASGGAKGTSTGSAQSIHVLMAHRARQSPGLHHR